MSEHAADSLPSRQLQTPDDLLELCRFDDPLGVLSIYIDADPREQASERPPWAIEVDQGLKAVRASLSNDEPVRGALDETVERIGPMLERLTDSSHSGRGRALFAALGDERVETRVFQLPVATTVTLQSSAFVRPFAAVAQKGAPAGLVRVARHSLDLIEWAAGVTAVLATYDTDVDTSEWTELKGPAGANPARAQQTAPQRDRFQRHLEQGQRRELIDHVDDIAAAARDGGWHDIVLAGDSRLTEALKAALPSDLADLAVTVTSQLTSMTPTDAVASVMDHVVARRGERTDAAAEAALGQARAGGKGALGLEATLASLAEGRVRELFLEESRSLEGFRVPGEDRLVPRRESVAPEQREQLVFEPFLGERMIERALLTGASVSLLPSRSDVDLGPDGVAASLRW